MFLSFSMPVTLRGLRRTAAALRGTMVVVKFVGASTFDLMRTRVLTSFGSTNCFVVLTIRALGLTPVLVLGSM